MEKKVATSKEETTIKAKSSYVSGTWANIKAPKLWDVGIPNLYNAITSIFVEGKKVDEYKNAFLESVKLNTLQKVSS